MLRMSFKALNSLVADISQIDNLELKNKLLALFFKNEFKAVNNLIKIYKKKNNKITK